MLPTTGSFQPPPAPRVASVQRNVWINLISFSLGYFWLISGLDKTFSGKFVSGFSQYLSDLIQFASQPLWFKNFLESFVLPNGTLAGLVIQYAEVGIGAIIIAASIQSLLKSKEFLFYTLAIMHLFGFLLTLGIILSQGSPFPFINTNKVFESGVNLDYTILFVSFSLILVNIQEAVRR